MNRPPGVRSDVAVVGVERRAVEADLILSAVAEDLQIEPSSAPHLADIVGALFPAAGIDAARLGGAMAAAVPAGYVSEAGSPGEQRWVATDRLKWSGFRSGCAEEIEEATSQLLERAVRFGEVSQPSLADGRRWAWGLLRAVADGVSRGLAAATGRVDLVDDVLVPRALDEAAMRAQITRVAATRAEERFLRAQLLDAVDPSNRFLRDPVQAIITAHLLHAFLARRDRLRQREQLGSLRERTVVLDTPCVVPLLGPDEARPPIEGVLATARRAGMTLVLFDHTVDELHRLLRNLGRRYRSEIEDITAGRANRRVVRLMLDQSILATFAAGIEAGEWRGWPQFAARVAEAEARLEELGVVRQAHRGDAADMFSRCHTELSEVLGLASYPQRGERHVEWDARTMAEVWRLRAAPGRAGGILPAAWVLTPDRHIPLAYGRANPKDPFPLTVSPSVFAGVVATCSDPVPLDRLAGYGAALLAQESLLAMVPRYSPEIALAIARELSGETEPETDVRLLQLDGRVVADALTSFEDDLQAQHALALALVERRNSATTSAAAHAHRQQVRDLEERLARVQAELASSRAATRAATEDAQRQVGSERTARREAEVRARELEAEARAWRAAAILRGGDAARRRGRRRALAALTTAAVLAGLSAAAATTGAATGWLAAGSSGALGAVAVAVRIHLRVQLVKGARSPNRGMGAGEEM